MVFCVPYIQATVNITAAVRDLPISTPVIIAKTKVDDTVQEAFLACESQVVCKVNSEDSILYLLAAFYSYHMQFPKGLRSLYTLFEILFLNQRPKKVPSIVSSVLSCISSDI